MNHFKILCEIVALISASVTCWEIYRKTKLERTTKLEFLINKYMSDVNYRDGMYLLDYSDEREWYTKEFHALEENKKRDIQIQIDTVLYVFDYVCYLKLNHIISRKEFHFLSYDINKLVKNNNKSFWNYMHNLYHYSQDEDVEMPFNNLFLYAMRKGYVPAGFCTRVKPENDNNRNIKSNNNVIFRNYINYEYKKKKDEE